MADVALHGMNQLLKDFQALGDALADKEMENELLGIGNNLKRRIKSEAPKGPTRRLKRSIISSRFKKKSRKFKHNPATFVAVDRKIAPHAHLVEFGTVKMAAKSFFRSTIDSEQARINENIKREAKNILKKTVRRRNGAIVTG